MPTNVHEGVYSSLDNVFQCVPMFHQFFRGTLKNVGFFTNVPQCLMEIPVKMKQEPQNIEKRSGTLMTLRSIGFGPSGVKTFRDIGNAKKRSAAGRGRWSCIQEHWDCENVQGHWK